MTLIPDPAWPQLLLTGLLALDVALSLRPAGFIRTCLDGVEFPENYWWALIAINVFVPRKSQAMLNSVDDLLQHLFILSADDNTDVRRQVCKAFVQLVDARPDKLEPHIPGLVDYILAQQKSDSIRQPTGSAESELSIHPRFRRSLRRPSPEFPWEDSAAERWPFPAHPAGRCLQEVERHRSRE